MDHDTFIITVYCLVVEHYEHFTARRPLRHGGFAPQLTDAEVNDGNVRGVLQAAYR